MPPPAPGGGDQVSLDCGIFGDEKFREGGTGETHGLSGGLETERMPNLWGGSLQI